MLLDRIDIDAHGPLSRVELGPLAEHMNVICGPEGSGKTAIARFIRDSLVNRRYPLGMMNSSTGRVVWADRNGKIHCRREQDGTAEGRRTIEFESRGDSACDYGSLKHSWLGGITGSTDASRAAVSIQLPESIVDCVITDTAVTNVARIVSACVRNGLDSPETYRSLPLAENPSYLEHDHLSRRDSGDHPENRNRQLRAQLADVEAELARINSLDTDYRRLSERRDQLTTRLASLRDAAANRSAGARPGNVDQVHVDQLRRRQSELRRWIAELDAELARLQSSHHSLNQGRDYSFADYRETLYREYASSVDDTLRRRLDDLDTQMIRWRRMLMEIRGLRDSILHDGVRPTYRHDPFESVTRRRQRLDGFLHAIDRYAGDRYAHDLDSAYDDRRDLPELRNRHGHVRDANWARYDAHDLTARRNAEEIDSRIDAATRQIDWLLERYRDGGLHDDWYQTLSPSTYRSTTDLAGTLQSIREDLSQVANSTRRQYDHHRETQHQRDTEARRDFTASELDELRRSERWLVDAIEQLTRHRESLLRDFTSSLTMPPSSASTAPDSLNIHLWDAAGYAQERAKRVSELSHVNAQLQECLDRISRRRRDQYDGTFRKYSDKAAGLGYGDSRLDERTRPHTTPLDWANAESIRNELRHVEDALASASRAEALRSRRAELLEKLQVVRHTPRTQSPLADDASRWLVRLSAGRLRRIEWDYATFHRGQSLSAGRTSGVVDANGARLAQQTGVRIDGRDEIDCSAADRAVASLAVRLAAGDLLARTGRTVPLVIETSRELLVETALNPRDLTGHSNPYSLRGFDHHYHGTPLAFYRYGDDRYSNHPIAAALSDYSQSGRQVVVLTSDTSLSDQIDRAGGRRFDLHGQHVVHPHRPLWRSKHETEKYTGPYPHSHSTVDPSTYAAVDSSYGAVDSSFVGAPTSVHHPQSADVNRNFDLAWREAHGIYDHVDTAANRSLPPRTDRVQTDWAVDGVDYRDGYYYADTYTTVPSDQTRSHASRRPQVTGPVPTVKPIKKPESPFFLSVDSPIDQAPSVDAIAAARLRGLNVSHINHLMQQDANRLSDALGLASVDASVVRRWQSECRLVCRVPQLRGFDARILVGCGITDPAQLAAIAPADLLDRVKTFLATELGQRILLSGSSYELSRITSWIAAANSSASLKNNFADERVGFRRYSATKSRSPQDDFDSARYEYRGSGEGSNSRQNRVRRNRIRTVGEIDRDRYDIDTDADGYSTRNGTSRTRGNSASAHQGSGTDHQQNRDFVRLADERLAESYRDERDDDGESGPRAKRNGEGRRSRKNRKGTGTSRSSRSGASRSRSARDHSSRAASSYSQTSRSHANAERRSESGSGDSEYRFYLQRDSDVVDAPSIGGRMAERLNAIGIYTVNDLLQADPEATATELDYKRVDADTIVTWQQQAALVCRIPMLRGHDAQLLVAAEVTTPEELVTYTPDDLFALIDPISNSSEGKRILRGGILPDLKEITDWIDYAGHHRELMAA
tara:strand:- start:117284 stop:121798 length:4515 start_codon:yes stop_codon:yes gene_type:complete